MKSQNSKGLSLKEVILQFSSKKGPKIGLIQSKIIKDYGIKLKVIDTLAAVLGLSGISIEYYLVTPT